MTWTTKQVTTLVTALVTTLGANACVMLYDHDHIYMINRGQNHAGTTTDARYVCDDGDLGGGGSSGRASGMFGCRSESLDWEQRA